MKITKEILGDLEDEFKLAQMCCPTQADLLSEIFIAYSHLERIFNGLKHVYEREDRYHETKQKLELARITLFRDSDDNPLKPLKIRSKK